MVAGKCFFITDGNPTSGLFLISSFNSAIFGEECYRDVHTTANVMLGFLMAYLPFTQHIEALIFIAS